MTLFFREKAWKGDSMELEEYIQYHESKKHEQPGFSYNTYLCSIPQDFEKVNLHWHEQMEIIYIKKGSGIVTVNLKPIPVSAGYIIPILPGELHSISIMPAGIKNEPGNAGGIHGSAPGHMEYENIIFSLSILDSREENDWCRANVIQALEKKALHFPRPIVPGTAFHTAVAAALDEADTISGKRDEGYPLMLKSCLFRFIFALYTHKSEEKAPQFSSHEQMLKKIILFVREHFSENITIEKAAAEVEYSPSHFMRFFKQETGHSFVEYLNEYRIAYAGYLLKESSDAIGEIASRCGFDNFSYFIRLFKRKNGVTPKEYRKSV